LLRLAEAADAAPSLRTSAPNGAACVRDCEVLCSDGGHVALALGALAELLTAAARAVRASTRQEARSGSGGRNGGGGNGSERGSKSAGGASGGAAASKAALQHAQRKVAFLQVSRSHPALAITAPSSDHPPLRAWWAPPRSSTQLARSLSPLQAWWASQPHEERHAACAELQFALRCELARREAMRRASAAGGGASGGGVGGAGASCVGTSVPREARKLIEEL
jgi:hypothetical protein